MRTAEWWQSSLRISNSKINGTRYAARLRKVTPHDWLAVKKIADYAEARADKIQADQESEGLAAKDAAWMASYVSWAARAMAEGRSDSAIRAIFEIAYAAEAVAENAACAAGKEMDRWPTIRAELLERALAIGPKGNGLTKSMADRVQAYRDMAGSK